MKRLIGLMLVLLTLPVVAQEPVYRWKDAQGSMHFGTRPPEGVPAEPVNLNAQPVGVTAAERVYTWKDSEGNLHYGDRPPADGEARVVDPESNNLSTIRGAGVRAGEKQLLRQLEKR